ncbi:hypothetical protein BCR34DRAFT_598627 [Clohesyomyces aquaticus]|uniref:Uncharacterized protein n=1 Tax=Clohesyomyces aquaticus TaxID=1231657 RepID=A0A1Y1ZY89_9PLEO|nr:hypothetical protein BCR34DRAFT_598627 [Clohesyomyces aquaticus]
MRLQIAYLVPVDQKDSNGISHDGRLSSGCSTCAGHEEQLTAVGFARGVDSLVLFAPAAILLRSPGRAWGDALISSLHPGSYRHVGTATRDSVNICSVAEQCRDAWGLDTSNPPNGTPASAAKVPPTDPLAIYREALLLEAKLRRCSTLAPEQITVPGPPRTQSQDFFSKIASRPIIGPLWQILQVPKLQLLSLSRVEEGMSGVAHSMPPTMLPSYMRARISG